jgi:hypothetical protein
MNDVQRIGFCKGPGFEGDNPVRFSHVQGARVLSGLLDTRTVFLAATSGTKCIMRFHCYSLECGRPILATLVIRLDSKSVFHLPFCYIGLSNMYPRRTQEGCSLIRSVPTLESSSNGCNAENIGLPQITDKV